jgi:hypothetical protein
MYALRFIRDLNAFRIIWLTCYFGNDMIYEPEVEDIARLELTDLFDYTWRFIRSMMNALVGHVPRHEEGGCFVGLERDPTGRFNHPSMHHPSGFNPLVYWMERFRFAYPEVERDVDTRWDGFETQPHRGIWNMRIIPVTPRLGAALDDFFGLHQRPHYTRVDIAYLFYIYTNTGVIVRHVGLYTCDFDPVYHPWWNTDHVVILYDYDRVETTDTLNRMYLRGPHARV